MCLCCTQWVKWLALRNRRIHKRGVVFASFRGSDHPSLQANTHNRPLLSTQCTSVCRLYLLHLPFICLVFFPYLLQPMKLCNPSAIVFLLPFLNLAASRTISGAADCVEARGFSLCQNVLADCTFTPLYLSPSKRTNGSRCFYVPDNGVKAAQNSTHHRSAVSSIAWSTEYHWNTTDRSTEKSCLYFISRESKRLILGLLIDLVLQFPTLNPRRPKP
jgi:hypothetical protein